MRKLSLFSGIGGIDLAAHWAGMETVAFCEREPFPQAVLRKHWPNVPIYDDVCTLTADRLREDGILGDNRTIDIISAGYPCQPFSNAGKRRGEEDDRHLWPEVARLLSEIRPRWFLGENVVGHITLGLDIVLNDLEKCGYTTQTFIIPSAAVNAPHRRDRIFIVAHTDCERPQRGETSRDVCQDGTQPSDKQFARRDNAYRQGPDKSQLGGMLDGLSSRLDQHRWPAALGQDQYDWEPPRVTTGIKDRVGRLKALGNAVNPHQVYLVLAAIKAINDNL
ncbi:putative BsuMI modification methylase subunit YdiP [compost metagenome]